MSTGGFLPRPLRYDPKWRCPFHDRRVWKVSRVTGRRYPGCDQCYSFARLTLTLREISMLTGRADDLPF